jgi:hypothetical protein
MLASVDVGVALPLPEVVASLLLLGRWFRGGGLRRFLGLLLLPVPPPPLSLLRGLLLLVGLLSASFRSDRGDVALNGVAPPGGDCAGLLLGALLPLSSLLSAAPLRLLSLVCSALK